MDMSAAVLWEKTLLLLGKKLNRFTFELFIKRLVPVSFISGIMTLEIPSTLEIEYFDAYRSLIEETISSISNEKSTIVLRPVETPQAATPAATDSVRKSPAVSPLPPSASQTRSPLNPIYTFENFVVGQNNRLCHGTALACSKAPGKAFNPLFIYGGVGLGKTHIMQAVGNQVAQSRPNFNVMYITTDSFINDYISSIQANKRLDFRAKFNKTDLLLIDDIQFLKGKDSTQNEFFNIFNNMQQAQKQIVITCDRLPREIPEIGERLRNRLGWGLIADIKPPDYETRLAILQMKMKRDRVELPLNLLEIIASRIKTNIRGLEGTLNRIVALATFNGQEINEELVIETINDISPFTPPAELSIEQIITTVSDYFKIARDDILGSDRRQRVVRPRRIAMNLCRELTDQPLVEIGKTFDKNHATVIYSINKLNEEMQADSKLSESVNIIRNKLKNM